MKNYQYMNLEQKMAKIRKKMPSLLKKFHNDEADYDFATLDDIYESMTPALNKYGVNFDITGERPTQYDAQGRPVYLTQGPDGFWRYESDLEICWTNVDKPKEKLRVIIHAIGTHEIPDKAHGTAMTYSLKYYFRNKFCMRQIDSAADDPDSMEHPEKDGGNKRKESSPSNTGKDSRKESSSSNAEKDSLKKSESAACDQRQDEKAVEQAAGSKENRIDGNLCRNPERVGESLRAEEKAAEEKSPEEKKTGKPTAANSKSGKGTKSPERPNFRLDAESRGETGQKKTAGAPDGPVSEKKQESSGQMESEGPKLVKMQADKPEDTQKQQTEEKQTEEKQAEELQTEDTSGAEDTTDGFQTVKEEDVPFKDADFLDELEQEMEEESKETEPGLEEAKNYICPFGVYAGRTLGDMMNSGLKEREVVKWIANHFHGPDTAMVNAAKLLVENADAVAEPQAA